MDSGLGIQQGFLSTRIGAKPDRAVLDKRLAKIESRHPAIAGRKKMTRAQFAVELRAAAEAIDERAMRQELAPLLPPDELTGLLPRLRGAVVRLAEQLDT